MLRAHLTQAPEEWSLEEDAQVEMVNVKEGFSQWGVLSYVGKKGAGGDKGQEWGGISARSGDAQQVGRDAGSQQAGQHNADELQQRQPQGGGGNISHVAADEGGHAGEAAVAVQGARVGRAAAAAAAGPAAAEGHGAVLLQPPGRARPVAVAPHAAAGQGALQRVQRLRHAVVLAVGLQGPAQPLLEALRQGAAVQPRRQPRRQPGRQHGRQEGAVGPQQSPVLRGGAEAAQEAPDDDSHAGDQEDGGGAGVGAGRQRQVSAQRHLGPEADDEHGQPRCPEDEAEGHEGQLEQGHGALGPWCRGEGGGCEGLPLPSVPPGGAEPRRCWRCGRVPPVPRAAVGRARGRLPAQPEPDPPLLRSSAPSLFEGAARGGPEALGGRDEPPSAAAAGPRSPGSSLFSPGEGSGWDWQLPVPAALLALNRKHSARKTRYINL